MSHRRRDLTTRTPHAPSPHAALGEHLLRLQQLEALPPRGAVIYVDDRILTGDDPDVVFDSFPASLALLELTWRAALAGGAADSLLYLDLNGNNDAGTLYDSWWNIGLANQVGSQGSLSTDDPDGDDSSLAVGYIGADKASWGRLTLPSYDAAAETGPLAEAGFVIAQGGWGDIAGGHTPDTWIAAGAPQQSDAVTKITVRARDIGTFATQENFLTGSRFTLIGLAA